MVLLIHPSELTKHTPMGGNIDTDKYTACMFDAQMTVLQPLIGEDLYTKIETDFTDETLSGDYLTLYNDYIKPLLRHAGAMNYFLVGAYIVGNGGIYKHAAENSESITKSEIDYLYTAQRDKVAVYGKRMEKWLKSNPLPEYTACCKTKVNYGSWHI